MTFRISRRALLRGAGAAMALPVLEAMFRTDREAYAQEASTPLRFFVLAWPMGVDNDLFLPTGTGPNYVMNGCLDVLADYKDRFAVVTGLRKAEAWESSSVSGDAHVQGHGTTLTASHLTPTGVAGISVDQAAADHLWKEQTRFRSIVARLGGSRDKRSNMSWITPDVPTPLLRSSTEIHARLFGMAVEDVLAPYRPSVLDVVRSDAQRLRARVGRADRARLDRYFDAVSEVERRVRPAASCAAPAELAMHVESNLTNAHADTMIDLLVLALACDLTRVAVLQLGARQDYRKFEWLGWSATRVWQNEQGGRSENNHHGIQHDLSVEGREAFRLVIRDQLQRFAKAIDALEAAPLLSGSLWQQTLALCVSEHGSAPDNSHYFGDVSALIGGGAGGRLRGHGTHVRVLGRKYGDMLLSLLRILGHPAQTFGVRGTQPIDALVAV